MKKPMVIVAGPTAVGKTALSLCLAKAADGEIISADSMQVYRHMDIGSAKIRKEEMQGVPHHLVDVLEPWEPFNVSLFQHMAKQSLSEIYGRNHLPIVVGGTGFYIQALLYDIDFTEHEADEAGREELVSLAKKEGTESVHRILEELDPLAAKEIHPHNLKRVIRAIEYCRQTGETISDHNRREREKTSPYDFYYYVLTSDRETIYRRIERRVDRMLEEGLADEVRALLNMGCTEDMVSMQGLGYKEIIQYLNGSVSLEEAADTIKRSTRRFAKRQLTWFKREKDIRWILLQEYRNDRKLIVKKILSDIGLSDGIRKKDEKND